MAPGLPRTRLPLLAVLLAASCGGDRDAVVVYTSVDDVFARPILAAFEAETGIRVLPRFDVEAAKTTGLYQALLAERERPRADVFWNSEVARTLQLDAAGVLAPYESPSAATLPASLRSPRGTWAGFGLRARVLVYHRGRVGEGERPRSLMDLTRPRFRGRAAIAEPLFGTTATHAGALRARLGAEGMETFFRALLENDVKVLAGNSVVRDRVASGELEIGLTDTDDVHVALEKGLPLGVVFPDQEGGVWPGLGAPLGTFAIPNTVAIIACGPRPDLARRFVDFLLLPRTEERLARGASAQIPARPGIERPLLLEVPDGLVLMEVPYEDVARGVEESTPFLKRLFAVR